MRLHNYLNEKITAEDVIKLNKGREGKPIINIKGKEVSGTVYLGGGAFAEKSGTFYKIIEYDDISDTKDTVFLTSKQFKILQKARI